MKLVWVVEMFDKHAYNKQRFLTVDEVRIPHDAKPDSIIQLNHERAFPVVL